MYKFIGTLFLVVFIVISLLFVIQGYRMDKTQKTLDRISSQIDTITAIIGWQHQRIDSLEKALLKMKIHRNTKAIKLPSGYYIAKASVRHNGLQPEITNILPEIERIWRKYGQEVVVTSAMDGTHMHNSKHYEGLAIDLRTRYFDKIDRLNAFYELKNALGSDYDVVMEISHLHVEYDPKEYV